MFGTDQSLPRARGRSLLALSTLALLAFCCLPVLAYGSSTGYQYQDAPPTATGKPPSEKDHDGSQATSGVPGKSSATGGNSPGGSGSDEGAGGSATKSGGGPGGSDAKAQQGSQAKDGKDASISGDPAASNTEPGSDDGGTSPLVLALMAVLVLGLGSVAYLAVKRRRDDDSDSPDSSGSPVSPEAS